MNTWKKVQVGSVADVNPSLPRVPSPDETVSFLSMSDVGEGKIISRQTRLARRVLNGFTQFADGDILIAKITPCFENGKGCRCEGLTSGLGFGSTEFIVLRPKSDVDSLFLFHLTTSDGFRKAGAASMVGSAGQKRLQPGFVRTFAFSLPPLPEQKAIVSVVTTWDRGIRQLSDLIAAKLRFKQGLMQQLLTGKRRFPEFTDDWDRRSIESFLVESRIPGTHGAEAKKLTVKLYGKGVIPKTETRAGSTATKYYRRKAGQFIYSKLDFLNGAFGIIPTELDGFESTLDLPAFDIGYSVDPDWFRYFVVRETFYKNLLGLANGGRKARRVIPDDLLKVSIPFPAKLEQSRIADTLNTADREIEFLRKELDALKTQKKGLMQKLLTGQVRVASGGR
jgi:type I restriction enzyme S subunit